MLNLCALHARPWDRDWSPDDSIEILLLTFATRTVLGMQDDLHKHSHMPAGGHSCIPTQILKQA
jgi:hypothetical protein